jgi:hypothetical protein
MLKGEARDDRGLLRQFPERLDLAEVQENLCYAAIGKSPDGQRPAAVVVARLPRQNADLEGARDQSSARLPKQTGYRD